MASVKVTITLPESQVEEIRTRVAAKQSDSVSEFVQKAVQKSLEADAAFRVIVDQVLMETGGPVTPKERAWARKAIAPRRRRGRSAKPREAA